MVSSTHSNFKLAVIADIHGNSLALKEVLKDIDKRGIDNIVNLGDSLYGPIDPAGTADILIDKNIPSIHGNEDRILIEESDAINHSPSLQFTKKQLKEKHLNWLNSLEKTKIVFENYFLFHGTHENDTEYLLHNICNGRLTLKSENEISASIKNISQDVILCGHDHTPNIIKLGNKLIVNPGSVGCPAYFDNTHPAHSVEMGNPFARYSILISTSKGWQVENIAVTYDWDKAAKIAEQNGRHDWVSCLLKGRTSLSN